MFNRLAFLGCFGDLQFTTEDARTKLRRLYPQYKGEMTCP